MQHEPFWLDTVDPNADRAFRLSTEPALCGRLKIGKIAAPCGGIAGLRGTITRAV